MVCCSTNASGCPHWGDHEHQNATAGDALTRRTTANASAPRLPTLRPEDVLIQRDAHGQKVLLGKGGFGKVMRRQLDGVHAAFCTS